MSFSIHGVGASKGIAIGRVYVVERGHREAVERKLPAREVAAEVRRFKRAVSTAKAKLRRVKRRIPKTAGSDITAFIDTHLLMLGDAALSDTPTKTIRTKRCNAEWALKLQRDALVGVFAAMNDPYLRTRRDDVKHVVDQIMAGLAGEVEEEEGREDGGKYANRVIFADDLTPADTVLMQHQNVAAFITEFGGANSHTAILARSLRIPAVVGLHGSADFLRHDEMVVVDGRQGVIIADPEPVVVRQYRKLQKDIERISRQRKKLRKAPAATADGQVISLQANVELPSEAIVARDVGAAGIGLYRTEFLFMNRSEPPDEEEQYKTYRTVVEAVKGAPVTIRTLDLGADKQVDGVQPGAPVSTNPALGLRAVRLCLKEPALFRPHLKAIMRASAHGPVRMMIPMISSVQELSQTFDVMRSCRRELDEEGLAYDSSMPIGAMIEVPAAALCADLFARHLDFLSIGTNDLIQYTMAIDRIDDQVNYLYDPMHPAVLRLIELTIKAGLQHHIPVAMCGEMAGDVRYTRLLLGLGLKDFSVPPSALLEVKQALAESHIGESRRKARQIIKALDPQIRERLLLELNGGRELV